MVFQLSKEFHNGVVSKKDERVGKSHLIPIKKYILPRNMFVDNILPIFCLLV